MSDNDQKTELPTDKKKRDAAKKGDVLQSKELATALVMVAGCLWIFFAGQWFVQTCAEMVRGGLSLSRADIVNFDAAPSITRAVSSAIIPVFALFALTILFAVATPAALGSLGFRTEGFAFKGNRVDPLAGLSRMFGANGLIELAKAIAKTVGIGLCGFWAFSVSAPSILGLAKQDINGAIQSMGQMTTFAFLLMTIAVLAIALIDVPIQIMQRTKRLMMSKQELRDEYREADGAPEIKQARNRRRHELLSQSARKAVTQAHVILTNPTHFAIALRYDMASDAVPIVVARGRGESAQAIRSLAMVNEIPTLEYPQLARALYFTVRTGHPVTEQLYLAVATVLAFVFNLDRAMGHSENQPGVNIPLELRFDENGDPMANDT